MAAQLCKYAKMYWIVCTLMNEMYSLWIILYKAILKISLDGCQGLGGGHGSCSMGAVSFVKWTNSGVWLYNSANGLYTVELYT